MAEAMEPVSGALEYLECSYKKRTPVAKTDTCHRNNLESQVILFQNRSSSPYDQLQWSMSRNAAEATFASIYCGVGRDQSSASKHRQPLSNYILIENHHGDNIFQGELLGVNSRREPSL